MQSLQPRSKKFIFPTQTTLDHLFSLAFFISVSDGSFKTLRAQTLWFLWAEVRYISPFLSRGSVWLLPLVSWCDCGWSCRQLPVRDNGAQQTFVRKAGSVLQGRSTLQAASKSFFLVAVEACSMPFILNLIYIYNFILISRLPPVDLHWSSMTAFWGSKDRMAYFLICGSCLLWSLLQI